VLDYAPRFGGGNVSTRHDTNREVQVKKAA